MDHSVPGSVYVVVEFAPYGNLRQYLRSRRPPLNASSDESTESDITMPSLVSFSLQVSKGMQFLADRKVSTSSQILVKISKLIVEVAQSSNSNSLPLS